MDSEVKKLYQCPECGLHYEKEEEAKACETWCREKHSCNLEITVKAIENKMDPVRGGQT